MVYVETDRYHFLKTIPIFEIKYRSIISGISCHCKIQIRISADNIGKPIHRSVSSLVCRKEGCSSDRDSILD